MIAITPETPYYAVIFTSVKSRLDSGYAEMARRLEELAPLQEGFLGMESAREEIGITVSYWRDLECIRKWRQHAEHSLAQKKGRSQWYDRFRVRVARVEREYGFEQV